MLRQGWLAQSKQAHNARKTRNNGHIWLKQDSELVYISTEQAREESKACEALDFLPFHSDGPNAFSFYSPMKLLLFAN